MPEIASFEMIYRPFRRGMNLFAVTQARFVDNWVCSVGELACS